MYKLAIFFTLFVALTMAYEKITGTYANALNSKINSGALNNIFLLHLFVGNVALTIWMCFWDNFFGPDGTYAECSLTFAQFSLGLWKTK